MTAVCEKELLLNVRRLYFYNIRFQGGGVSIEVYLSFIIKTQWQKLLPVLHDSNKLKQQ